MPATAQFATGACAATLTTVGTVTTGKRSLYLELTVCNTGSSERVVDVTIDSRYVIKGHATNNFLAPGQSVTYKTRHHLVAGTTIKVNQNSGTDCEFNLTIREAPSL